MMKRKKKYSPPAVLRETAVFVEESILTGSIVNKTEIESKGQDVVQYDYSDDSKNFNHTWE